MKLFSSTILLTLGIGLLTGMVSCGGSNDTPGGNNDKPNPVKPSKKYDLVYRSWDLGTEKANNEERQLVKKFEELKGVKVKIVENAGSGNAYWDGIRASVTTKIDLADVMMIPNLDWPLKSNFLADIKDLADTDPEFQNVPTSIKDACTFKNGVYALPARMNLQGYFLNTTVAERDLNLVEATDYSVYSDSKIIKDIIGAADSNSQIVGLDSAAHFIDTQASVYDKTGKQGYFTWDGEQYHLDEEPFIKGVQEAAALYDAGKTLDSYDDEKRLNLGLDPEVPANVDAWNKQKLVLRYGYTYEIPDMLENNSLNSSYKFIGNPGGKISIVGDYYGIYKETKNRELAYEFAKFMSFGIEGFRERMDLYAEKGAMNSLPLTNDQNLIDEYFRLYGSTTYMTGLEDAFEYIKDKSMVEGVKVVPGYLQARQNKKTGVDLSEQMKNVNMFDLLDACYKSGKNIADYTSGTINIDTMADKTYTEWLAKYGDQYK